MNGVSVIYEIVMSILLYLVQSLAFYLKLILGNDFILFFYYYLHRVSGPAYAHHDYSSRPTGHPASPGAGKTPRG